MKPFASVLADMEKKFASSKVNPDEVFDTPTSCHDVNGAPCEKCKGAGWYLIQGEPHTCENYNPSTDIKRQETLSGLCGISNLGDKTFDNFVVKVSTPRYEYSKRDHDNLKAAYLASREFSKNPKGWLVLEGPYGVGKTHLALAIANALVKEKGLTVKFITSADILDSLRASFSPSSNLSTQEVMDSFQNVSALIIDDYGAESPTEWAREKLFQLLNVRHENNSITVITTNVPLNKMPPRIQSRMKERGIVKYIECHAPDYRKTTSKRIRGAGKIPPGYEDLSFSSFWGMDTLKEVGQRWVKDPFKIPFLYIFGDYGTGKTHLASAIANDLLANNRNVTMLTAKYFSDKIIDTINDKQGESLMEIVVNYKTVEFLVIDGLDTNKMSSWVRDHFIDIMDHRSIARLPTVITSIYPIDGIDKRLYTRLLNSELCFQASTGSTSFNGR